MGQKIQACARCVIMSGQLKRACVSVIAESQI